MRVLSIIKVVRLPQSNPSILLFSFAASGIFLSSFQESILFPIFFPSKNLDLSSYFGLAKAYIFFHPRRLWSMRRARSPSILLPLSEICKDGLYLGKTLPWGSKGQSGKNPNKEFDTRNTRRRGKFLFVFFLLFLFFPVLLLNFFFFASRDF